MSTGSAKDRKRPISIRRPDLPGETGSSRERRVRSVALFLVLIVVLVAAIVGSAFVSQQSTSVTISHNIEKQSEARHVAETGIELTIAYIRANEDWREDNSNGVWLTNKPFGGGAYSIEVRDGWDINGNGAIAVPAEGDGDLDDDDGDPFTITSTGRVDNCVHIARVVVTPGCQSVPLLGHWEFDESSGYTANDSSGNDYHGTLWNMSSPGDWVSGQLDGALDFDENNDYVELTTFPNLSESFTITAWVRPNNIQGDQRIFCDDRNNSGGFGFSVGDEQDGRLRFFNRSVNPIGLDANGVMSSGVWQHVAAVHNASDKKRMLYRNGTLVAQDGPGYSGTFGSDPSSAAIGGELDGTSEGVPHFRFGGRIDDVRVYDGVLSAEQIATVSAGGSVDCSASGGSRLLFVVENPGGLVAQEVTRKALFESWGYVVELIDTNDSSSNYDNAIDESDLIYLSSSVGTSLNLAKIEDATIGIVNEENGLYDEFAIASGSGTYGGTAIDIVNISHYITWPFSTGALTIATNSQDLRTMTGTLAPSALTLAERVSSNFPTFMVVDKGGSLYDGSTAAGRRVMLPWGLSTFDVTKLTAGGNELLRRTLEWAAGTGSSGGGNAFDYQIRWIAPD